MSVQISEDVGLFVDGGVMSSRVSSHKYKVAYTVEPVEIIGTGVRDYIMSNQGEFDLILTDQRELLALPNARLFPFATPWMENRDESYKPSVFGVSTVVGRKVTAPGHIIRHVLWNRRQEITKVPRYFYVSHLGGPSGGQLTLGPSKDPLFYTKFHIAIENSFSDYYMSEKVVDCFRMKVVPVYMGAKRIGDYFDARGIIQVNSIDEMIVACNGLTDGMYEDMLPYIEENYRISEKYLNLGQRIEDAIKNNINIE